MAMGTVLNRARSRAEEAFYSCVIPDGNSDSLIYTRRQKDPIWRPSLMVSTGSKTPCKSHEPVWGKERHCWLKYSALFVWQKVGQLPPWFAVGQKDPRHRMLQYSEITSKICISVWCEVGVQVQSFACGYSVATAQFVERTVLLPLNCPGILVENQLITGVRVYFWILRSISLIRTSVFMPLPYSLGHTVL